MSKRPSKHHAMVSLGFLFCLVACACADRAPDWSAEIARNEAKWREHDIDDYRVVVRVSSLWHMQTHSLIVQDGVVVEMSASCTPAPIEGRECEVRPFRGDSYAVPGLFDQARWIAEQGEAQHITIEFDARYGYPTRISYDDPEVIDEEWGWGVPEFEPLE